MQLYFSSIVRPVLGFLILYGIPGLARPSNTSCGPCPGSCPCPCTLEYIANAILPFSNNLETGNLLISGEGRLILRKNEVLYVHQYTPVGASNQLTVYLPIKHFGNTDLYFYRLPEPGQPMGGWVPVDFQTSTGENQQLWTDYLSCNQLPYLSKSEINQITALFLPGCCCPCR